MLNQPGVKATESPSAPLPSLHCVIVAREKQESVVLELFNLMQGNADGTRYKKLQVTHSWADKEELPNKLKQNGDFLFLLETSEDEQDVKQTLRLFLDLPELTSKNVLVVHRGARKALTDDFNIFAKYDLIRAGNIPSIPSSILQEDGAQHYKAWENIIQSGARLIWSDPEEDRQLVQSLFSEEPDLSHLRFIPFSPNAEEKMDETQKLPKTLQVTQALLRVMDRLKTMSQARMMFWWLKGSVQTEKLRAFRGGAFGKFMTTHTVYSPTHQRHQPATRTIEKLTTAALARIKDIASQHSKGETRLRDLLEWLRRHPPLTADKQGAKQSSFSGSDLAFQLRLSQEMEKVNQVLAEQGLSMLVSLDEVSGQPLFETTQLEQLRNVFAKLETPLQVALCAYFVLEGAQFKSLREEGEVATQINHPFQLEGVVNASPEVRMLCTTLSTRYKTVRSADPSLPSTLYQYGPTVAGKLKKALSDSTAESQSVEGRRFNVPEGWRHAASGGAGAPGKDLTLSPKGP